MLDLCREVSELYLYDWQTVEIITDMIYVRLDITTIDAFQNAICNSNFFDREVVREIMNNLAKELEQTLNMDSTQIMGNLRSATR